MDGVVWTSPYLTGGRECCYARQFDAHWQQRGMHWHGKNWPIVAEVVHALAQYHTTHKTAKGRFLQHNAGSGPPRTRTLRLTSATLPHLSADRLVGHYAPWQTCRPHARRQPLTCRAGGGSCQPTAHLKSSWNPSAWWLRV